MFSRSFVLSQPPQDKEVRFWTRDWELMDTKNLVEEQLEHFYQSLQEPIEPDEEPDTMMFHEQKYAELVFGMSLHTIRPTFVRIGEFLIQSDANAPESRVNFGDFSAHLSEVSRGSHLEIILLREDGTEYKIELEPGIEIEDEKQSISISKMDRSLSEYPHWHWFAQGTAFLPRKIYDDPETEKMLGGARVYGRSAPDRWAKTFQFLDFAKTIKVDGTKEAERVASVSLMPAEGSLTADGFVAGPACKAAARAIRTETMKKIAPWAAERALELDAIHREQGVNFGEAYFLHNDLDNHSFRVPTKDGRIILFHMNVSLINDSNSCVFIIDTDDPGKPTAISLKTYQRGCTSREIFEELSEDGLGLDAPNFKMDLKTGDFETSEEFDSVNLTDFMVYGLGFDLTSAREHLLGDEPEKWIRSDFEFLDPEEEFEDDVTPAI